MLLLLFTASRLKSPPVDLAIHSFLFKNLRVARFVDEAASDTVIVVWTNNTGTFAVLGSLTLGILIPSRLSCACVDHDCISLSSDTSVVKGWFTPMKMPFGKFYDVITLPNQHFIVAAETAVYAGTINGNAMNITAMSSVRIATVITGHSNEA